VHVLDDQKGSGSSTEMADEAQHAFGDDHGRLLDSSLRAPVGHDRPQRVAEGPQLWRIGEGPVASDGEERLRERTVRRQAALNAATDKRRH
jgi:hypothetical protein